MIGTLNRKIKKLSKPSQLIIWLSAFFVFSVLAFFQLNDRLILAPITIKEPQQYGVQVNPDAVLDQFGKPYTATSNVYFYLSLLLLHLLFLAPLFYSLWRLLSVYLNTKALRISIFIIILFFCYIGFAVLSFILYYGSMSPYAERDSYPSTVNVQ